MILDNLAFLRKDNSQLKVKLLDKIDSIDVDISKKIEYVHFLHLINNPQEVFRRIGVPFDLTKKEVT